MALISLDLSAPYASHVNDYVISGDGPRVHFVTRRNFGLEGRPLLRRLAHRLYRPYLVMPDIKLGRWLIGGTVIVIVVIVYRRRIVI